MQLLFRVHNTLLPKTISIDLQMGTEIHTQNVRSANHYSLEVKLLGSQLNV